jgi:NADPH:quinone reductase
MKAIVVKQFGEPSVMKIEEVPDLKAGPGQVVVRIHAAGVNPVETYIRAGVYPRMPTLPYTPGMDGAGVVMSIGKDVTRVKVGDRVYLAGCLTGTYAEQGLCDDWAVFTLPAHVSFAQGAAMHQPYATAFRALFDRANAQGGETVLIHGASGGVGIAPNASWLQTDRKSVV